MPNYRRAWVAAKKTAERPLKDAGLDLDDILKRSGLKDFGPTLDAFEKDLRSLSTERDARKKVQLSRKAYAEQTTLLRTMASYKNAINREIDAPNPGVRAGKKRLLDALDTIKSDIDDDARAAMG